MGRYVLVEQAIFDIFGSAAWIAEGVSAIPNNVPPPTGTGDYVRLTPVLSGNAINRVSIAGLLQIDIFTVIGKGPRGATLIADTLDTYLHWKRVGRIQFSGSTLVSYGADADDPMLHRALYSIPFNYYGVL